MGPVAGQRTLRIFISSPGDVADEREKARQVIEGLQRQFRSVILQPVLWEDLPLPATASFQETIDYLLSVQPMDVAIFVLWSRLGSPLGPASVHRDGSPYRSGTEREFDLMLEAFEQSGRQRPVILAYARDDERNFLQRLTTVPSDRWEEFINQQKLARSFIREHFQDEHGRNLRAYHSYREPVNFAQRLQVHLREVLSDLVATDTPTRWAESPYRGLEFFNIEHAAIFQGRDNEACEVLQRLRDQDREGRAFVVILGASGSGKSSLARAGVAATLQHHPYDDGVREWKIGLFIPGLAEAGLLNHLARILAEQIPELGATLNEQLLLAEDLVRHSATSVRLKIQQAFARAAARFGGSVRLLLILDQMEELWTNLRFDARQREQFFAAIEALAGSGHIAVLATLRSDFYPQAQTVPAFLRLKGDRGHFDLLPPGPVALQRIISEPARLAGLEFDTIAGCKLDEVIAEDAAHDPSALPLLEYALSVLYEHRDDERRLLTFAAYEQLGRVEGALGQRASEQFRQLPSDVQAALPDLLPLLITFDPAGGPAAVRRRTPLSDLTSTPEREVLTRWLIAARFLTTDRAGDVPVASLAHEALLHKWKEVSEWIGSNRELLRLHARIEQAEARWKQHNRDASLLLPAGLPLEEGKTLLASGRFLLSGGTAQYIQQSLETHAAASARRRRHQRSVLMGLSVLAIAAIAMAIFAWMEQQESASLANHNAILAQRMKTAAETASSLATEKATLAEQMEAVAERATLLAAEKTQLAAAEAAARRQADAEAQTSQRLASKNEELATQHRMAREDAERKARELQAAQTQIRQEFARAESERARAEAGRYQVQLARISYLGQDDPEQAIQLLQSRADCPLELRDFTWSLLFANALDFPRREERIRELELPSAANVIVYTPDGTHLAVGHADGTITLWNLAEHKLVSTLRHHVGPVLSLAVSPAGDSLASGGEDARLVLWQVAHQKVLRTLKGHAAPVQTIDFSTDGELILSGSARSTDLRTDTEGLEPGELILWSARTGERVHRDLPPGAVFAARFQPKTQFVVIGRSDETEQIDIESGAKKRWPPPPEAEALSIQAESEVAFAVDRVAFSSDGECFCAVSHRIPMTGQTNALQQSRLKLHGSPRRIAASPEPPPLPNSDSPLPADDAAVPDSGVANGRAFEPLPRPMPELPLSDDVHLSPPPIPREEGMPAISILQPGAATVGHPRRIGCVVFSPDGRTLVTGDSEGHLQLRDPATGGIRLTLRAHLSAVQSVAFAPDGSALASACGGPSPKIVIHHILPPELKIRADKVGWWLSARDVLQNGYDRGMLFSTIADVELAELRLAESEAALAWAANKKELAVRKLAQALSSAERHVEMLQQHSEVGILAPNELATAVELLGRLRLAHYRIVQASSRPSGHALRVISSQQPILRQITGGLPPGAASPKELHILEELAKASERPYRLARVRWEVGVGSQTQTYATAARYDLARASVSWANGDSTAAVDLLRSAARLMEWASPVGPGRDDPQLLPSLESWNALSQCCDMQLALVRMKGANENQEFEPDFEEVVHRTENELQGRPGVEELRIFDETIRSLEAIHKSSQLRAEAGTLSPLEAKLIHCRILVIKSDRAWAAGDKREAERFLADAVAQINDVRPAAEALYETGYPDGERVLTEVTQKQLEIQLAFERLQRTGPLNAPPS